MEIDSHILYNYVLLDIAVDLLGVPSDNVVELTQKYGDQEGFAHPDIFSRDWVSDLFIAMIVSREDYDGFIAAATNPNEWLPDGGWSSDDDIENYIYNDKD